MSTPRRTEVVDPYRWVPMISIGLLIMWIYGETEGGLNIWLYITGFGSEENVAYLRESKQWVPSFMDKAFAYIVMVVLPIGAFMIAFAGCGSMLQDAFCNFRNHGEFFPD